MEQNQNKIVCGIQTPAVAPALWQNNINASQTEKTLQAVGVNMSSMPLAGQIFAGNHVLVESAKVPIAFKKAVLHSRLEFGDSAHWVKSIVYNGVIWMSFVDICNILNVSGGDAKKLFNGFSKSTAEIFNLDPPWPAQVSMMNACGFEFFCKQVQCEDSLKAELMYFVLEEILNLNPAKPAEEVKTPSGPTTVIQTFEYCGVKIRSIMMGEKPYLCGDSVAQALGYKYPKDVIALYCPGSIKCSSIDSIGREQETNFIPEPDVYRLLKNSPCSTALQFNRWIFEFVLPVIRMTSFYIAETAPVADYQDLQKAFDLVTSRYEKLKQEHKQVQTAKAELTSKLRKIKNLTNWE